MVSQITLRLPQIKFGVTVVHPVCYLSRGTVKCLRSGIFWLECTLYKDIGELSLGGLLEMLLDQISQIGRGSAVAHPEQACPLPIILSYLMAFSTMVCMLISQSSICLSRNCVTAEKHPNERPAIHHPRCQSKKKEA